MPQLDFSWWMIKFFMVWAAVFLVLMVLVNKKTPQNLTTSNSLEMSKSSTKWQWL